MEVWSSSGMQGKPPRICTSTASLSMRPLPYLAISLARRVADPDHSSDEHRCITIGLSNQWRLLMVAHAERGDRIRIISARTLTRSERRAYEETHN